MSGLRDTPSEGDEPMRARALSVADSTLERVIDAWAYDYGNEDWRALSADEQLAVALRIIAAVIA